MPRKRPETKRSKIAKMLIEEKWGKKISNVCKLLEKQLGRIIDIF